nr:beta-lactamase family protein [Saprospiraceae bacterium]
MIKSAMIILVCFIGFLVNAQDFDRAKIDSLFAVIENNQKAMGSISIYRDGVEIYSRSIGYASLEGERKADENTVYRIGSISKTFTAAVVLKLVETGQLSLNSTLGEFYPQFENADKITLEDLLRHRSGIYNFTNTPDYLSWNTRPFTRQELLAKLLEFDPVFEPGARTEYSNSNYVVLTMIAEYASEKSFAELVREIVAEPCGLQKTAVGTHIDVEGNEASSYSKYGDWKTEVETDMSIPLGAGAVISTPGELNTFLHCLFQGDLLKKETLEEMTSLKDGFGMGLFQVPFYDKRALGHTGGIDGFQSVAVYFPEENLSVAYLSNGVDYPMNDILIGVMSIYFVMDYSLPEFTEALSLTEEQLEVYLGTYTSLDFPLDIFITQKDGTLIGQATGQPSFPLECFEEHKFRFERAMLELEFFPDEDKMILRQGGGVFELSRME